MTRILCIILALAMVMSIATACVDTKNDKNKDKNDSPIPEQYQPVIDEEAGDMIDKDIIKDTFTSSDDGNGNYSNPVIFADVPDIDFIRVDDAFYMVSTTMHLSPGCPIMKSYDLVNWEIVNYVFNTLADQDNLALRFGEHNYGKGQWASTIRHHDGMFYVNFLSYATGKSYMYYTDDIENGKWERFVYDEGFHDPSLLFDDDGKVYLVYGGGSIWCIELEKDLSAVKPETKRKIIDDAGLVPGCLAEGAHIYKHNGYYYIFIITWPSGHWRTQLCYRSKSLDGEWERKVILEDNIGFRNDGVAQGGIIDDADGNWYCLLFQDHGAVGRVPVLMPMVWEDDWPVVGTDGKVLPVYEKPIDGYEKKGIVTSDEFINSDIVRPYHNFAESLEVAGENDYNGSNLGLEWQWNHNPDNRYWSLTEREGYLRLTTGYVYKKLTEARNTVSQRTFGPVSSAFIKLDTSNMLDGDIAGLSAFAEKYGYVGVKMEDGKKYIAMAAYDDNDNVEAEFEKERVELTQDELLLRVDCDFTNATDKANFYYSLDGDTWHKIGSTLQMNYYGLHFMGYRFAIFNYATKTSGGYVDVDFFRVNEGNYDGVNSTNTGFATAEEESSDDSEEGPADEPVEEPAEQPIEEPVEEPAEEPVEEPAEEPAEEPKEEPAEEPVEEPVEEPAEEPKEEPEDEPEEEEDEVIDLGNSINTVSDKVYKPVGNANPISSNIFCADPTSIEYNGRLYVYGTCDSQQKEHEASNNYAHIKSLVCFSTDDMVNWVYHGRIDVEKVAPWIGVSWAPSIVSRVEEDGKTHFYLYFSNGGAAVGVITSTSPTGPWSDPLGKSLIYYGMPGLENCPNPFDPGVVIDENGVGWLAFGGGNDGRVHSNVAKIVRLGKDMISLDSDFVSIDAPYFNEASELNYIDGTYYYSYCNDWQERKQSDWDYEGIDLPPGCSIAYMTTKTPLVADSWEYKGAYLYNAAQDANGNLSGLRWCNNHSHIQEFKGTNYIIHHTMLLEESMNAEGGFRSMMVEYLPFDEKTGEIGFVGATKKGVKQIKDFDPYAKNSGSVMKTSAEIDFEQLDNEGNVAAVSLNKGSWICVTNADFGYGADEFMASVSGKGRIEIRLDSLDSEPITALEFNTSKYKSIKTDLVKKFDGRTHDIYILFSGKDIKLQSWQFAKAEETLRPEDEEVIEPQDFQTIHFSGMSSNPGPDFAASIDVAKDGDYSVKSSHIEYGSQLTNVGFIEVDESATYKVTVNSIGFETANGIVEVKVNKLLNPSVQYQNGLINIWGGCAIGTYAYGDEKAGLRAEAVSPGSTDHYFALIVNGKIVEFKSLTYNITVTGLDS